MTAPRSFGFSTTAEASEEAVKTNATFKNWILTLGAMIVVAACSGEAAPVYFAGPILEGSGPNGELALDGAVVNDSAQAAAYVQVTFILYNEDGQVVETLTELVEGDESLGTLNAGDEGTFFVISETSADQIARIDYVIGYDESSTDPQTLR